MNQTAFDVPGQWYKGVTHFHSTNSDGAWTAQALMDWYRARGYHFAALTDHCYGTDTVHLSTSDFLTIPGIEIHGYDAGLDRTPHIVGLGAGLGGKVDKGASLQGLIDFVHSRGMLAVIAHPYWSSLRDEHLSGATGYVGIEIYNETCRAQVGKGDSLTCWDNLLYEGRRVWGLAVDDAHCQPDCPDIGGGWIVVKAPELTEAAILSAIRAGHFYASQGPAIADWRIDGGEVTVRCSPVERIQFHGPNGAGCTVRAPEGGTIGEATAPFKGIDRYLRVTVIDHHGKRAWTNPVFAD